MLKKDRERKELVMAMISSLSWACAILALYLSLLSLLLWMMDL